MANHTTLTSLFTDIANSIREKTGSAEAIIADNFPEAIDGIPAGVELNFSVVGYASEDEFPETAEENTIAVITESEITGWVFSITEPESPIKGMVWFSVGISSPTSFDVLKENSLMVYPTGCQQYIDGAWTYKVMQVYQNSAWVSMELVLFDGANTSDTNDFYNPPWSANTALQMTLSCSAGNYVEGKNNKAVAPAFYFGEDVDFTGYNTLTVTAWTSVNAYEKIIICPEGYQEFYPSDSSIQASTTIKGATVADYTIDISAFSEKHRIGFYFGSSVGSRYIRVYKIKLSV